MMKKILPLLLFAAMFLQACSNATPSPAAVNTAEPIVVPSEAALATPETVPTALPHRNTACDRASFACHNSIRRDQ